MKSNEGRKNNCYITYNPSLTNINLLVKQYLSLLRNDENLKELFSANIFKTKYRDSENLKELLSPSHYPCILVMLYV